jgi:tetratricopeptide (TPR) repeat protein
LLDAAIQRETGVASFHYSRSVVISKLAHFESTPEGRDGLLQRAESDLREGIRLDPSSKFKWSIELAQLLARLGKLDEAVSVLNSLLSMDHSSEPSIRIELAKIFSEADDFEKACQQVEVVGKLAQQLAPEMQEFRNLLSEGLDAARKAKEEPANPAFELTLGSVQSRLKHLEAALRHYQRAVELDSSSLEAHKQLGNIYYKQNRTREAIDEWLKSGEDALTLNNLGAAFDALNDYERALSYYQRAHEKADKNFVPLYNLGSLHFRQGNWAQARDFYAQASQLNPQFAAAHLNRGNANFRLNQFNDAENDWRAAIQRDEKLADARYNLGVSLWSREANSAEAVDCWKQAWLLDFNFTLAEDNLLAAKQGKKPNLEIVDLKNPRETWYQ